MRKLLQISILISSVFSASAEVTLYSKTVNYDPAKNTVIEEGDVVVYQELENNMVRELYAEKVLYNKNTKQIELIGSALIKEPTGEIITSNRVKLDADLQKAIAKTLEIILKDTSKIRAKNGDKNGNVFTLNNATYSPCKEINCSMPLWDLQAEEVIYDKDAKKFVYKNVKMRVKGFPVMFTPYFSHPSPEIKRKTGFLTPFYRTESDKGLFIGFPFFVDVASDKNLKMTPYLSTHKRAMLSAEYMQKFYYGDFGLTASFLTKKDKKKALAVDKKTRWRIDTQFQTKHFDNQRITLKIDRSSDLTYKALYPVDSMHRADMYLERKHNDTKIEYERFGDRYYFVTDSHIYQTRDRWTAPKIMPHIKYLSYKNDILGGQFAFQNDTVSLERDKANNSYFGDHYFRTSNKCSWNRSINFAPVLLEVDTGIRLDLIHASEAEKSSYSNKNPRSVKGQLYPVAENKVTATMPMVTRICNQSVIWGPKLTFSSVETSNSRVNIEHNEDSIFNSFGDLSIYRFNSFGGFDSIENGERVVLGVEGSVYNANRRSMNAFVGRSQSIGKRQKHKLDGKNSSVGRLVLRPWDNVSFRSRFVGLPGVEKVQLFESGVNARIGKIYGGIGYLYDKTISNVHEKGLSQVGVTVGAKLTEHWNLSASQVFNLKRSNGKRNLTRGLNASYIDECLDVRIGLFRANFNDKDIKPRTGFMLVITFKNLGNFVRQGVGYNFNSPIGRVA